MFLDSGGIVVGVDADGRARPALEEALRLGARLGRHVHVVHVMEEPRGFSPTAALRDYDRLRRERMVLIGRWVHEILRSQSVPGGASEDQAPSVEVISGKPMEALLERCREARAAGLVLGAHGASRRDVFIGGTAARLVGAATCPVLVRRGPHRPGGPVLVAVDASPESGRALEHGRRAAESAGVELITVTALPSADFLERVPEEASLDYVAENARRRMESEVRAFIHRRVGDAARVQIRAGEPWEQIAGAARGAGADLVVMGSHGRTGLKRVLLGSVTERVLRGTDLSVLVVKVGQEALVR